MLIYYFKALPSTQLYALNALKEGRFKVPFCIHAMRQTQGIGSRGNAWEAMPSALTFSFVLSLDTLPQDLRIESSSIFFGVIMREFLRDRGSSVWLKYPNDLYIDSKKIGGILTQKVSKSLICGIGINLSSISSAIKENGDNLEAKVAQYATLEPEVSKNIDYEAFLSDFFKSFEKFSSWKQIFSIYALEFRKNDSFYFHYGDRNICLRDTTLNSDGSLSFEGKRIFSLR